MTICKEIMTANPRCHEPMAPVGLVAKTMMENNIGPIPIVDDKWHLLGIVTDRDLAMRVLADGRDGIFTKVKEVMTENPVCCYEDDRIEHVLKVMEECQIRRIPVVDKDDKLVGIISQADIATRLNNPSQIAEMVESVSQPTDENIAPH